MKKGYLILLVWFGAVSCNPEIDLTAEYKDIPVVYGLLNRDEPMQYIRIQKAFLLNGNVLDAANVADSNKYDPSDLLVRIVAVDPLTGEDGDTIHFTHRPEYLTQPGAVFPQNSAMLYASNEKPQAPKWRLEVENVKRNTVTTAETNIVYGMKWIKPNGSGFVPFTGAYTLMWTANASAAIYQPEITFRWMEVDSITGASRPDSLIWALIIQEATPDYAANMLTIQENDFFKYVGAKVPVKHGVKRVIGSLSFKIMGGTKELGRYIDATKPSIGLIQEKPAYTNIQGGLGIFSSRAKATVNMEMTLASRQMLVSGVYTSRLNFSLD